MYWNVSKSLKFTLKYASFFYFCRKQFAVISNTNRAVIGDFIVNSWTANQILNLIAELILKTNIL